MPLPWIRLDTSMPDNPKILHLIDSHKEGMAAAFAWVCSIAYCGKVGTDGFLSRSALARTNARARHPGLLTEYGFWVPDGGGWTVHDYLDYNPTTEDVQRRSEKARDAAARRWHSNGNGMP